MGRELYGHPISACTLQLIFKNMVSVIWRHLGWWDACSAQPTRIRVHISVPACVHPVLVVLSRAAQLTEEHEKSDRAEPNGRITLAVSCVLEAYPCSTAEKALRLPEVHTL